MRLILRLIFICSLLICSISASAFEVVQVTNDTSRIILGKHIKYFEDKSGVLDIEQVIVENSKGTFSINHTEAPSFGFTPYPYWFHFRVENKNSNKEEWFLQLEYPLLDQIVVYQRDIEGNMQIMGQGDLLPFEQRNVDHRTFIFDLKIPKGAQKDIYVQIKTHSSMQATMNLWDKNTFYQNNQNANYLFGIYYGVIFSMLLYNLMIFFSIREKVYLYYVTHVLTFSLFQGCLNGLTFQFLWPDSPWWGQRASVFFLAFACFNAILFTRKLLELETHLVWWDKFFSKFMIFLVIVMIGSFFISYRIMGQIGTATGLVCAAMLYAAGWVSMKKKTNKLAQIYVLAWTIFLFGAAVYSLKSYALLPQMFITEYAMQIGSMLDVVLLSLILSYRVKLLQQKNIQMQKDINIELEHKVKERTTKLNETLDALTYSYEKIKELTYSDALTGVRNRRFFDDFYKHEWNNALRSGNSIALILIDVDHFKIINDSYGHRGGDAVLTKLSNTINENLPRKNDTVARYGGDEFIIMLPLTDKDGAILTAKRIMDDVQTLNIEHDDNKIQLTVSIGVSAIQPTKEINPDILISQADKALYDAKNMGRNLIRSYQESSGILINTVDN